MTGPGARLDAENANLQAYCDRLEAEIGPLRAQLRANLAALRCEKQGYPIGSSERWRCACDACVQWCATRMLLGMDVRT